MSRLIFIYAHHVMIDNILSMNESVYDESEKHLSEKRNPNSQSVLRYWNTLLL